MECATAVRQCTRRKTNFSVIIISKTIIAWNSLKVKIWKWKPKTNPKRNERKPNNCKQRRGKGNNKLEIAKEINKTDDLINRLSRAHLYTQNTRIHVHVSATQASVEELVAMLGNAAYKWCDRDRRKWTGSGSIAHWIVVRWTFGRTFCLLTCS